MSTVTHFKLAASSYLNTAPLIWSFLHGSQRDRVELIDAVPARCSQLLAEGEVSAALVPIIEYQRVSGISLVPDVCVGSKGEVRSVVLVSKCKQLDEVRRIALDESSRTSATLVKIIFFEFLQQNPEWTTHTPNIDLMLAENDAALIIGDPAMTFSRDRINVWDLATVWRNQTGFGFVFAMWMVRDDKLEKTRSVDFAEARIEGLSNTEAIVDEYQKRIPLSKSDLRRYITSNIAFQIDESMDKGLRLYFQLAHKHRLIDDVKPLRFTNG
ncbi:MAG: menaquinone biosynthetic enzyme MqnA/MqnD family protein [Pyrinomonadaceae bacterium]